MLVYFTGGLDSPFSFLYLVSIITASMLLYRRGGLLGASGAVILYGVLGDLMYYRVVPLPEQSWFVPTAVDLVAALPEHGHELRRLLRDGAADVVISRRSCRRRPRSSTPTGRTWPSCVRSIRTSSNRFRRDSSRSRPTASPRSSIRPDAIFSAGCAGSRRPPRRGARFLRVTASGIDVREHAHRRRRHSPREKRRRDRRRIAHASASP